MPTSPEEGWFLRDIIDTDRVLASPVSGTSPGTVVLRTNAITLLPGDLLLVRGATALEVKPEDRPACNGMSALARIRTGESKAPLIGEATRFESASPRRTPAISALARVTKQGDYAFEMLVGGDKASCKAQVLEPATLTVAVFTQMSRLTEFKKTARMLFEVKESTRLAAGQSARVATSTSGPPITTIAKVDWNYAKGDAALVFASASVTAEDRLDETTSWLQVTRAPANLNSHLSVASLSGGKPAVTQSIFDWDFGAAGGGRTTFYLNAMGTGENQKPLAFADPGIKILHFRRVAGRDPAENVSASSASSKSARQIDLFELRTKLPARELPPAEDSLPCPLFKSGSARIAGLPAIDIPTPVHARFNTRWENGSVSFQAVVFENIYHDNPVWALDPPAPRRNHYTERFFDVVIRNPASPSCAATGTRR